MFTSQADGLKEGHPGAGPQVEQIVLGVLHDWLALVPVVVHVEALAVGVGLTPTGALRADPSFSPTVQTLRVGSDELVTWREIQDSVRWPPCQVLVLPVVFSYSSRPKVHLLSWGRVWPGMTPSPEVVSLSRMRLSVSSTELKMVSQLLSK